MRVRGIFLFLLVPVLLLVTGSLSEAATYTWDGGDAVDANWDSPANWTADSGYPDALGDVAQFTGNIRTAISLNGNRALQSLAIVDYSHSGSQPGFTFAAGSTLTLADGGSISSALGDWFIPAPVFNNAIALNGSATFSMNRDDGNHRKLTFAGPISGSGPLLLTTTLSSGSNRGAIAISNANSGFSGQVTLDGIYVVEMNNATCFGTNPTVNLTNNAKVGSVRGAYNWNFIGNGTLHAYGVATLSGNVIAASGATATLDSGGGNSFTVNGVVQGQGILSIVGGATNTTPITLGGTASNTLSGGVQVRQGYLALNKTPGLDAIASDVTVGGFGASNNNAKVLRLGNDNQIKDSVLVTLGKDGTGQGILRMNGRSDAVGGLASSSAGSGIVENESGSANTGTLTLDVSGGSFTYSGSLRDGDGSGTDGVLALTKKGAGAQVLGGAGTYTGATRIEDGLLQVDGSVGPGSAVTVVGGALGGGGTINGPLTVTVDGAIAPGASAGTLTAAGGITLDGTYRWELVSLSDDADGTAGTDWDLIDLAGASAMLNNPVIELAGLLPSDDPFWTSPHTWTILSGAGGMELLDGSVIGYEGQSGSFGLEAGDGQLLLTWSLNEADETIPEPGTMALLALTGLALSRYRRRRCV